MEKLIHQSNWQAVKRKLMDEYSILTERDFTFKEGEEEKLLIHLSERLGKSKKEIREMIRNF